MKAQKSQMPKVFISYSHKDEEWKNRLLRHLQFASREGNFEIWEDRRLKPGDQWYEEITQSIGSASLAILLVSADYLNSDFIRREEVPRLLLEQEKRGMRLFPVILKDCLWDKVDWLAQFQARPLDGLPLANRRGTLERELANIAREAWDLVEEEISRRVSEFLEIYRKRLDSTYSRWDLGSLGVAQAGGAGRPIEASLDDMYLPLRLGLGYNLAYTEHGAIIDPETLLRRDRSLAIRGPAGAGKTTWMRWNFRQLLRIDAALPLMVVLRDLARKWQDPTCTGAARALDSFLEGWVEEHVPEQSVGLKELFTSKGGPRPVLLVDGWDEIGPLGEELRSKLMGLLRQYPRILAVVTSRPYGQGRPSHAEEFDVLDIQPLSNAEITDLSTRFFLYCHGSDQATVHKEVERFTRALDRSAEAKALARTALLLTMMLFISRSRPLPDKRHLLYEACIDNLLTALPNRKEEEGALLLQEQYRPEDSEERLRVVAALAASLQQEGYETADRSPIVRSWDEMAAALPQEWPHSQRLGFLEWLAGPAGLLVDRADGTLAFAHLSLQEYLTAWQLNATVEGTGGRVSAFLERLDNDNWWETLRLWAALIERQSRERLDLVLQKLIGASDGGLVLSGAAFADGLGTEVRFQHWLSSLLTTLGSRWPERGVLCARAWAGSRQEERRYKLALCLTESACSQSWLGWLRHDRFAEASLSLELPPLSKESLSRSLLEMIRSSVAKTVAHYGAGRLLCGTGPIWPVEPLPTGLLQVWPSHRRNAGLSLQFAQTCGASRADLRFLAKAYLQRTPREDGSPKIARHLAREYIRSGPGTLASSLTIDWARRWACDLTRYWTRYLAGYWAHDCVSDQAHTAVALLHIGRSYSYVSWCHEIATRGRLHELRGTVTDFDVRDAHRNWSRLFFTGLGINPDSYWVDEFVTGELFSWQGRASARISIADTEPRKNMYELRLLREACRLSGRFGQDASRFDQLLESFTPRLDPLWPALARHLARLSTPEDRALLVDLAQNPEKREPPLSWGLQFIVRGDVMLDDGSVVTLDELSDELGLPHLPYLDDMPDELEVDWEEA